MFTSTTYIDPRINTQDSISCFYSSLYTLYVHLHEHIFLCAEAPSYHLLWVYSMRGPTLSNL